MCYWHLANFQSSSVFLVTISRPPYNHGPRWGDRAAADWSPPILWRAERRPGVHLSEKKGGDQGIEPRGWEKLLKYELFCKLSLSDHVLVRPLEPQKNNS